MKFPNIYDVSQHAQLMGTLHSLVIKNMGQDKCITTGQVTQYINKQPFNRNKRLRLSIVNIVIEWLPSNSNAVTFFAYSFVESSSVTSPLS